MAALITLLLILFSTLVPIAFSKSTSPKKTLRLIQYATVAMTFIWAYLCIRFYPELVVLN